MPDNSAIKKEIIDKYVRIMCEYFDLMLQSEVMAELKYPTSSLYVGINSLHRVFEYSLLKTKSIETAYCYAQKTYYYYLEYMEQIHKSNLSQNLNHMDAILFVYKKTIFDIYDGDTSNMSNKMTNIMTLTNNIISIDEREWRNLFVKILKIVNIVFHWKNANLDFHDRKEICENYLGRFLSKFENLDTTISYLEIIQQKCELDYKTYECLLKEILEKLEKSKRRMSDLDDFDKNEYFLIKFYVEEPVFREKLEGGDMKDLVRWLYTPV
jgi:hypothetical protein